MTNEQRFAIVSSRFGAGGSRMGPKHRENEDSFRIVEPEAPDVAASHGCLYVVADGVGGHSRGEVASKLAVDAVSDAYFAATDSNPVMNLVTAIDQANLRVHEESAVADPDDLGMATTIVAVAVLDDQIVAANVGDSRAYLIGDGIIRQLSHDHSWVQAQIDAGQLTPEEARHSPRRNIITRALGLSQEVETEVKTETDTAGHTRLVLCTDGVHGVVDDDELAELVEGLEPQAAVERILAIVDERKGHDDATLIVVDLGARVTVTEEEPKATQAAFFPRVFRLFRRRK